MAAPTAESTKNQIASSATFRAADAERLRPTILMGNPPQSVAYEVPADDFALKLIPLPRAKCPDLDQCASHWAIRARCIWSFFTAKVAELSSVCSLLCEMPLLLH